MTKDNEDALRCAHYMAASMTCGPKEREAADHLRRLVRENEAKDALLRQAVQELEWAGNRGALVAAIRQHLEGRA